MKLGQLKALGHNFADSFASGIGFLIGVYQMDVFAEAAAAEPGFIEIDFVGGGTSGSPVSENLNRAISLYREELPRFAKKHSIDIRDIKKLSVRFGTDVVHGAHFTVKVESVDGRKSVDQYVGFPGRKLRAVKG